MSLFPLPTVVLVPSCSWVVVLGLLATLPIGIVLGSLVPGVQKIGPGDAADHHRHGHLWDHLPDAGIVGVGTGGGTGAGGLSRTRSARRAAGAAKDGASQSGSAVQAARESAAQFVR